MLNYQTPDAFFENSLLECGVHEYLTQSLSLKQVKQDSQMQKELIRILQDIREGADAVYNKGKPVEAGLDFEEWSKKWSAWASARKAAFFCRAALYILGDRSLSGYFLETLRNSHNIVFLGASSDVLQHATGHYLEGPEEDLTKQPLVDLWENYLNKQA